MSDIHSQSQTRSHPEIHVPGTGSVETKRVPFVRVVLISSLAALLAGLMASLLSALVMGLLRIGLGIPSPVELFGDYVLMHIDVNTFIHLLLTYKHPKTTPLGFALLGMIATGTVLGLLYAALVAMRFPLTGGYRPQRREWMVTALFVVVITLVALVLFWDQTRQNNFGLTIEWSRVASNLGLLLDFGVYGVSLCLAYRALLPKVSTSAASNRLVAQRRQVLARGSVAVIALLAGGGAYGTIRAFLKNYASYDGMKTAFQNIRIPVITPNAQHYVVTQNVVDPTPDVALWRLEVGGLINKPGTYDYETLKQLPASSRAITLECIANGLGDHLIGNAIWQGVSFKTLLEMHGGPQASARYVAFYSVDGYNISLPLADVLAADAMLAWNMNGVPLPNRHGFPLRVLIPGHYGEENPKWLTRVELTDHFVGGLYSDQGWYNGPVHTISRIDNPIKLSTLPVGQIVPMRGIAFSGNRGIQKVEVSTDGGNTWQTATLEPAISKDSWVFWNWQWQPHQRGSYMLTVRATDGTGEVQISKKQSTVPNGATGYDEITVKVI
jgi:DMSO/TMAO reductase YedYZ molybdopterin-dependent catalytic subunit